MTNIEKAWNFFMNPNHFEAISPRNFGETLVSASNVRLDAGTELRITTSLILKKTWHSIITKSEPYEFVDEVSDGFFKKWVHSHKLSQVEDEKTAVVDEITFECRYGLVGRLFEGILLPKLDPIFRYREARTREILERKAQS
jgi:ligand-binding SRPBCC domain-containing protein